MLKIDKIFVIVLPENIDSKKESIKDKINSLHLDKNIPLEIFPATVGSSYSNDELKGDGFHTYPNWQITSKNKWWNQPMKDGEIGCSISHFKIWIKAKNQNFSSILILEEDFFPVNFQPDVFTKQYNWDLIYLGRSSIGKDLPYNRNLVKPGYSFNSHSYVLNRTGINKLIKYKFNKNLIPIDEFLSATFINHPRQDIKQLFPPTVDAIAPIENMIIQDTNHSSTIEKTTPKRLSYIPIHPQLFNAFDENTSNWVEKYVNPLLVKQQFDLISDEPASNIFSFPAFTPIFCKEIIEEAENFNEWTEDRHAAYPTNDMVLNSFNFNVIYHFVIRTFVIPLLKHKYQLKGTLWTEMTSENFIARYSSDRQQHLALHNDQSDLSLVLSLNTDFIGGGTYYPKFKKLILQKTPGMISVHPGKVGYLHGAREVMEGTRYIIASFLSQKKSH